MLCDDGWTSAVKVRAMPAVADGLAIGAADWRRAAAFSVVSSALDGRESGVEALVEGLEGSLTPTDTEWSHTVEGVARLVQSGEIDATWDGFLTSLLEVLPLELRREPRAGTEDALKTARFLPDQDGRLISASDESRVFFRPVLGIDDAADLVEMVPNSLKRCIAFIHGDVRTHEEGSKRRRTAVHKFLDGRFAGGFGREEIVRDVVLEAVPPLPAAFGSGDADLCAELMGWTIRLLGEEPSEALLSLLGGLPVACRGGWHSADEAVFGPGWPESDGDSLWELAEELGETMGQRLRRTALLRPGDPRWGLDVGRHGDLFARIGVAEGLRLSYVDPVSFWMQIPGYELPREAPAGVDQEAWDGWRAVAQQEARPRHQSWFEYSLEDVYRLPELHGAETLTPRGRRALSRLVLNSMRCWPSGWEQATVRKVHGEWRTWQITSPLKHWLSTLPWLRDGPSGERPLSERWLVPIPLLQGQQDRFRHLQPLTLDLSRRLEAPSGTGRHSQGTGAQRLSRGRGTHRTGASQCASGCLARAAGARGPVQRVPGPGASRVAVLRRERRTARRVSRLERTTTIRGSRRGKSARCVPARRCREGAVDPGKREGRPGDAGTRGEPAGCVAGRGDGDPPGVGPGRAGANRRRRVDGGVRRGA